MLRKTHNLKWSNEERNILKELWASPKISIDEICKVFPERTRLSISDQANSLRITRPIGSTIDLEYLKKIREVIKG